MQLDSSVLVDSLIVPQCVYRPGSFTALMTVYESNFIKLRGLTGGFDWPARTLVSSSARDHDLQLTLESTEVYTTTLRLTYIFAGENGQRVPDPDLLVRVYHDARLVEAIAGRQQLGHGGLRKREHGENRELHRRWRVNMMLNKWLDYLNDVGHSFEHPAAGAI